MKALQTRETAFGTLRLTCTACPTQIEADLNVGFLYLRSRHGEWRVELAVDETAWRRHEVRVLASGDGDLTPEQAFALAELLLDILTS